MIHVQAQELICLTALPSRILDSSDLHLSPRSLLLQIRSPKLKYLTWIRVRVSFALSYLFLTRVLSLQKPEKEIMWSCLQFAKSVTVIRRSKFLMKVLNCKVSLDRSIDHCCILMFIPPAYSKINVCYSQWFFSTNATVWSMMVCFVSPRGIRPRWSSWKCPFDHRSYRN